MQISLILQSLCIFFCVDENCQSKRANEKNKFQNCFLMIILNYYYKIKAQSSSYNNIKSMVSSKTRESRARERNDCSNDSLKRRGEKKKNQNWEMK